MVLIIQTVLHEQSAATHTTLHLTSPHHVHNAVPHTQLRSDTALKFILFMSLKLHGGIRDTKEEVRKKKQQPSHIKWQNESMDLSLRAYNAYY